MSATTPRSAIGFVNPVGDDFKRDVAKEVQQIKDVAVGLHLDLIDIFGSASLKGPLNSLEKPTSADKVAEATRKYGSIVLILSTGDDIITVVIDDKVVSHP